MVGRVVPLLLLAACGGGSREVAGQPPTGPAIHTLSVRHESRMSESFRLVAMTVRVDGRVVFEQDVDTEDGGGEAEIAAPVCVYREMVQAGDHELGLDLLYRGRGRGVFSYLSGYRFRVRSEHRVRVPGRAFGVHVTSVGEEQGGVTTPLEDRPAVRWVEEVEERSSGAGCRPTSGAGG